MRLASRSLALIVGHRRVRTGGNVPEEVYVRRPDENQSWLAEGSLQVDSDPQLWLDRDIMNIDHSRIARVVVTRGDRDAGLRAGQATSSRWTTPADHPKLEDYKLEDVSRALELLTFEDVHPNAATPEDPDRHVGVHHVGRAGGDRVGLPRAAGCSGNGGCHGKAGWRSRRARPVQRDRRGQGEDRGGSAAGALGRMDVFSSGRGSRRRLVPSLEDLEAPQPKKPAAPAAATPGSAPAAGVTVPGAAAPAKP